MESLLCLRSQNGYPAPVRPDFTASYLTGGRRECDRRCSGGRSLLCPKDLWATLEGKEAALTRLTQQVQVPQGDHIQQKIALTDGDPALQSRVKTHSWTSPSSWTLFTPLSIYGRWLTVCSVKPMSNALSGLKPRRSACCRAKPNKSSLISAAGLNTLTAPSLSRKNSSKLPTTRSEIYLIWTTKLI